MENIEIQKPEEMAEFFNKRVTDYDNHMKDTVASFEKFYSLISDPIKQTQDRIMVIDLGCGTGLELEGIFIKAPNACITGIDMSHEMLNELKRKYADHINQLDIINDSYTTADLCQNKYDYAVSVMTMHHLLYENKLMLYKKIRNCLKAGGLYIEGDYIVSPAKETEYLSEYEKQISRLQNKKNGLYHIDIPFCISTQLKLLCETGFKNIDVLFKEGEAAIISGEA